MLKRVAPILAVLTPIAWANPGPGDTNDFHGKRVLIIGIDGLRSDALQAAKAPVIQSLAKSGSVTWTAVAGGGETGPTRQPTISGPGWSSILTGTCIDKHGVSGNSTKPGIYHVEQAPHFAKRLKESVPTANVASIVSWGWIEDYLVAAQPEVVDHHEKGTGKTYPERDADVNAKAVSYLAAENPDVLFVHFDQVDGAGHSTGFSTENPKYMDAITSVDGLVGELMASLKKRPQYGKENWLVILTTDHGGKNTNHGGQSPEERTIPMIVAGKSVPKLGVSKETPGQFVVPATTLQYLGVPVKAEWGWEPGTFGLQKPAVASSVKDKPKS
ncbi:alkaline phosphatase family protein [Luteolibacter sp. LG18]|uniref:alkaline phosphatase family protein n=1 Tax=Luteolibacter sp. LG18 TaxID=2819286 RepID=UPI002B27FB8F|nr:nucleotide pyrophosphatase [Luteolibacter sp. LG18]